MSVVSTYPGLNQIRLKVELRGKSPPILKKPTEALSDRSHLGENRNTREESEECDNWGYFEETSPYLCRKVGGMEMQNDLYEEHTWGHPGPYTVAYAEYPQGYVGPITVTHPNGQSKVIIVEAVHTPEFGPSDQEVEAEVIAALSEMGTLPALVEWKKYIPWIAAAGLGITLLIVLSRSTHATK